MKRAPVVFLSYLLLALIAALPMAAQADSPRLLAWIPDESAGFVALRYDEQTLTALGLSIRTAQLLQPGRIDVGDSLGFDDILPLDLFDLEQFSFSQQIAPWLDDEIVFVYRRLNATFSVEADDFLLMLETRDPLLTLASLEPVIAGQDLLERRSYRDIDLYLGDKVAFAVTPSALLIGSESMIEAAIDTASGDSERLIDTPRYRDLAAQAQESAAVSAYFEGEIAARAFSGLLGGGETAAPLLSALGDALRAVDERDTLASALLRGQFDAVAISLLPDLERLQSMQAVITAHTDASAPVDIISAEPRLLDFMPRSAAVVHSGSNATQTAYTMLLSLPLSNYAGTLVGGFPLRVSDTTSSANLPPPTADDLGSAFAGLNSAFAVLGESDLERDLIDHLDGSYALAVIPRPNAPAPLLGTPFDLLLVTEVDDAQAARDGVTRLVETLLGSDIFVEETLQDQPFSTLRAARTQTPLLSVGSYEDMLIVGTGQAAQLALDAQRGDNRLIAQPRWQSVSGDGQPQLYVDINPYYNLVAPQAGGSQPLPFNQLGLQTRYLGDGLYQIDLLVTLAAG